MDHKLKRRSEAVIRCFPMKKRKSGIESTGVEFYLEECLEELRCCDGLFDVLLMMVASYIFAGYHHAKVKTHIRPSFHGMHNHSTNRPLFYCLSTPVIRIVQDCLDNIEKFFCPRIRKFDEDIWIDLYQNNSEVNHKSIIGDLLYKNKVRWESIQSGEIVLWLIAKPDAGKIVRRESIGEIIFNVAYSRPIK